MVNLSRVHLRKVPWWFAIAVLALVALLVTWMPVMRMSRHIEINLNEGWNAYRARMADHGIPLYGSPPGFTSTNYPPLSFHLVGFAGRLTGDYVRAGRQISLISLAVLATLIAVFVRHITDRWHPGIYAALTFLIWLGLFQDNRIGMNDPQLFGMTINLFGLYAYAGHRGSRKWLCVSALAFAISVFTKHNLVAFPLAAGAHLFLTRSWRGLALWGGVFAVAATVAIALTRIVDGPYFFAHMNLSRPYYLWDFVPKVSNYVTLVQIPLAAALVWSAFYFAEGRRNILILAWACATAVALTFTTGYGVDGNIYFDSMVALALIVGVAANDVENLLCEKRFTPWILCVTLLVPLVGIVPRLPGRWQADRNYRRAIPYIEQQFAEAVRLLASRPGPAICHDLLVCYEAGKASEFDTFAIACQFASGKISAEKITREIDPQRFPTVEFDGDFDRTPFDGEPMAPISQAFKNGYRVARESGWYRVAIPKAESPNLK